MMAYLDLGSGSYFFQILLAGLLSGLFYAKQLWTGARNFFRKRFVGRGKS